jgi:Leucine-rich repeat (LRR) protein
MNLIPLCAGNISIGEYSALQSLYVATNGPLWTWPEQTTVLNKSVNHWIFPSTVASPCASNNTWYGLNCSVATVEKEGDDGVLCSITGLSLLNMSLFGSIPDSLSELSSLQSIVLDYNSLYGSLPNTVGNLSQLQHFSVALNSISGSVPWQLMGSNGTVGTTSIKYLGLSENPLTGTLPAEVPWSGSLVVVIIANTMISGPIPKSALASATQLAYLILVDNILSQSIPTGIGQLTTLEYLYLSENMLTSTLPPALFHLPQLLDLIVDTNYVTSSIPSEIGQASALVQLFAFLNPISGSLPAEIAEVSSILSLEMNSMLLSGPLPEGLGNMVSLQNVLFYFNSITGPLPLYFSPATVGIDFSNNRLTGTISTTLGLLTNMVNFAVGSNFITGSIPSSLGNLANLSLISLYTISLTGSLPTELGQMSALLSIETQQTYLTGSLPEEYSGMISLQYADLANCFFSSTLPNSLTMNTALLSFDIHQNMFSGSITSVFADMSSFPELSSIQLAQNSLSGSIPASMFQSSVLIYLTLFTNCFSGSLSESVCQAQNLSYVILDALSTAPGCTQRLSAPLSSFFKGVFPERTMTGSIPACLFSLPKLQFLHLAGNGFTGSLPPDSELYLSSGLQQLVLASNNLVGSIPASIQEHEGWTLLDLSSNRLSGTLSSSLAFNKSSTSLSLSVNRISGSIPSDIKYGESVNVLEGNLFACPTDAEPINDPDRDQYVCGSSNLDDSLITWIVCAFVTMIAFAYRNQYYPPSMHDALFELVGLSLSPRLQRHLHAAPASLRQFLELLTVFHVCIIALAFLLGSIGLLVFSLLKTTSAATSYSTHTVQFTWVTSIAYTHGIGPVVMILLLLVVSVTVVCVVIVVCRSNPVTAIPQSLITHNDATASEGDQKGGTSRSTFQLLRKKVPRQAFIVCVQLAQVVLTLAVNLAYIHAVFEGLSPTQLGLVQVGLSLYKTIIGSYVLPHVTAMLPFTSMSQLIRQMTLLSLFSSILVPALAMLFSDSSCLRYAVTGQSQITSSFVQLSYVCSVTCLLDLGCETSCYMSNNFYQTTITAVTPPWLYSYQCSSSLLVNYTPVLVLNFITTGLILPVLTWLHAVYAQYLLCKRRADATVHSKENWLEKQIIRTAQHSILTEISLEDADIVDPALSEKLLFNGPAIVTRLLVSLAILLTFGMSVPLLAFAIALDSIMNLLLWRKLISRYLDLAEAKGDDGKWLPAAYSKLGKATGFVETMSLRVNMGLVVMYVGQFWSVYIFDAVGDVYGAAVGGLVLLVPTVGLLSYYFVFISLYSRTRQSFASFATKMLSRGSNVEMNGLGEPTINPALKESLIVA